MYLDASMSLKQTLARNAEVEEEKNEMSKRLAIVEKRLKESTGRHKTFRDVPGDVSGAACIPTTRCPYYRCHCVLVISVATNLPILPFPSPHNRFTRYAIKRT